MKQVIFLFILIVLSVAARAQKPSATDSIYTYTQSLTNFQALKWGLSQLNSTPIVKASYVALNYNLQQGSFRQAQQAQTTNSAAIISEGISTIDRFKLYGYFGFKRTWQDSLAYSQKGIEDEFQPYYHFAVKAGNFERQTYTGGGIISYGLKKEHIFIGTGIDYLYNSSARSVDPRSNVKTFQLKFSPQLAMRFHNQTLGLGISAGYGDETVNISYKNDDYSGSLLFPSRISYLNYGFGFLKTDQQNFQRRDQYTGINLNYSGSAFNWLVSTKLDYSISKQDNRYELVNSINYNTFGTFQLEKYKFNLLINKKNRYYSHQFLVDLLHENGDDELIALSARNYTYRASDFNLNYNLYHQRANRPSIEYLMKLQYKDVYQKDASSAHLAKYTFIKPKIGAVLYWTNSNVNMFSSSLLLSYRFPLNNEVTIPSTQVNVFTTGVVYPDYLYWGSKAASIGLDVNYTTTKLINNFRTGLSLKSDYTRNLRLPDYNYPASSVPSGAFLNINLSLNLYF